MMKTINISPGSDAFRPRWWNT